MQADSVQQLSKRIDIKSLLSRKGTRIRTYSPSSPQVRLAYNPQHEGFIHLTVGKERALIHKDELLFVARFAKGSAAV